MGSGGGCFTVDFSAPSHMPIGPKGIARILRKPADCNLRQGARPLKGTYKGDFFTYIFGNFGLILRFLVGIT